MREARSGEKIREPFKESAHVVTCRRPPHASSWLGQAQTPRSPSSPFPTSASDAPSGTATESIHFAPKPASGAWVALGTSAPRRRGTTGPSSRVAKIALAELDPTCFHENDLRCSPSSPRPHPLIKRRRCRRCLPLSGAARRESALCRLLRRGQPNSEGLGGLSRAASSGKCAT